MRIERIKKKNLKSSYKNIISKFSEGTFKITDSYILFDAMITIEDQFPDDTWGVESNPPYSAVASFFNTRKCFISLGHEEFSKDFYNDFYLLFNKDGICYNSEGIECWDIWILGYKVTGDGARVNMTFEKDGPNYEITEDNTEENERWQELI